MGKGLADASTVVSGISQGEWISQVKKRKDLTPT